MALFLVIRERDVVDSGDVPPPGEAQTAPPREVPTLDVDLLELVGIAEANADQAKAAAESVAQEPGYRYYAVRYDNASVFDADPRPVSLSVVDPKKATSK